MLPNKVILVRHGETVWNSFGKFLGHSDQGLNEKGKIQAEAVSNHLLNEEIDFVFSSDLLRAVETSNRIAGTHNLPVSTTEYLREMNFGVWEGLTFDEIQARYSIVLSEWLKNPFQVRVPGGETAREVLVRAIKAWEYIIFNAPNAKTVVIVAHGGSLRMLLCHLTGQDPVRHWEFNLKHGETIVLSRSGDSYSIV